MHIVPPHVPSPSRCPLVKVRLIKVNLALAFMRNNLDWDSASIIVDSWEFPIMVNVLLIARSLLFFPV